MASYLNLCDIAVPMFRGGWFMRAARCVALIRLEEDHRIVGYAIGERKNRFVSFQIRMGHL